MKAVVLYEKQRVSVDDRPEPGDPAPGEVTVRVRAVGLCGSDLKYFQQGGVSTPIKRPFVLGHEAVGTISRVGAGVDTVKVGDRVTIEPGKPCWTCAFCRSGDYNLCPQMYFMASRSRDGALQEYLNWPANLVYPLPAPISDEAGALAEPISVALSGVTMGQVALGKRVLVLGAGTIGLFALQLARAAGASFVAVTDMQPLRLDIARALNADQMIDVGRLNGASLPLPDNSIDVIIDTTGYAAAIGQAYTAVKPGGRIVLIGLGQDPIPLSLIQIVYKQLTVLGVYRYKNTYMAVITALLNGQVQVESVITHRFAIDQAVEALVTATQADRAVKVMINL